jgi:DNA-binding NtrC family response regulator
MTNLLDNVIYKSAVMQQIHKELEPVVRSASPLFFWGESGSGMGFYARTIHKVSREGKFLKIPGFSLDEETVKQQFLGENDHSGWLEEANNGTIFLKRITEATPAIQELLLHFLSTQSVDGRIEFSRKGSAETLQMNVHFMFSMVHDFDEAIREGLLRHDLVDALRKRGKILHLPPLRERKDDIISIAENFLEDFNQEYHQHISSIDKKTRKLLINYHWPENVDELKRVIQGIFSQYQGITTISGQHIPDYVARPEKTGDKYVFNLKDGQAFTGKFGSVSLRIQREQTKFKISTKDLAEILRIEDEQFTPPRLKHFLFKLKDGNKVTGMIRDATINVETAFDASHKINVKDLNSAVIS